MRGTPQSLEPQCELHGGYQEVHVWMERNTSCPSLQPPQSLLGHWTISHLDLGAESCRWGEKARECTTASLTGSSVHYGRYTKRGFPTCVQKK